MTDFARMDDDAVRELVAKLFCHWAGVKLEDERGPNWWDYCHLADETLATIVRQPRHGETADKENAK